MTTKLMTYGLLGALGLFALGGIFLYAFPLQVRLSAAPVEVQLTEAPPIQVQVSADWPGEPLKVSHIYPLTFSFADYTVADALSAAGQFRVVAAGQWEVSPKAGDQGLFPEVFKLGHGVRVEKDADNWREGQVSGAGFVAATDTAPAYFSATLTGETTEGTLAAADTVTVKSLVTE